MTIPEAVQLVIRAADLGGGRGGLRARDGRAGSDPRPRPQHDPARRLRARYATSRSSSPAGARARSSTRSSSTTASAPSRPRPSRIVRAVRERPLDPDRVEEHGRRLERWSAAATRPGWRAGGRAGDRAAHGLDRSSYASILIGPRLPRAPLRSPRRMDLIEEIGAVLGPGRLRGAGRARLLYFQQARHLRRLREWAGERRSERRPRPKRRGSASRRAEPDDDEEGRGPRPRSRGRVRAACACRG